MINDNSELSLHSEMSEVDMLQKVIAYIQGNFGLTFHEFEKLFEK